jgi:hypothetical protein
LPWGTLNFFSSQPADINAIPTMASTTP